MDLAFVFVSTSAERTHLVDLPAILTAVGDSHRVVCGARSLAERLVDARVVVGDVVERIEFFRR